jgi:hypothetical protein
LESYLQTPTCRNKVWCIKHMYRVMNKQNLFFQYTVSVLVVSNSWPLICKQFQIFIPPGNPCSVTAQSKLLIWQINLLLWHLTILQNYCFQKSSCIHSSDLLQFPTHVWCCTYIMKIQSNTKLTIYFQQTDHESNAN